jgi:hypothetical protein
MPGCRQRYCCYVIMPPRREDAAASYAFLPDDATFVRFMRHSRIFFDGQKAFRHTPYAREETPATLFEPEGLFADIMPARQPSRASVRCRHEILRFAASFASWHTALPLILRDDIYSLLPFLRPSPEKS